MDVKSVAKQHGFTLTQVAKEMGVTNITLSQNLARNPTIKTLRKIADIIGCEVGDFFQDERTVTNESEIICSHCGNIIHVELKTT